MPAPHDPDPLTALSLCTGDPLARALSELEPLPSAVGRDQLMFAAGAAGRDRDVRFWKRIVFGQATAVGLLVGVGLALSPFSGDGSDGRPVERRVAADPAPKPAAAAPTPVPPPASEDDDAARLARYLQLRSDVLAGGIGLLPSTNDPAANVDVGKLEDSLQLPRGTFAIHGSTAKPKPAPENDDTP